MPNIRSACLSVLLLGSFHFPKSSAMLTFFQKKKKVLETLFYLNKSAKIFFNFTNTEFL